MIDDIDLNAPATAQQAAPVDIDFWKQTQVGDAFGLVATGINPVATTEPLPSRAEFGVAKLAQELGYSEVLTVGALEDGIRFYQQRTAECCLELGKRLLLLKELVMHGEFKPRIELLGINYRTAARFMSAARRFIKSDKLSLLINASHSQQKLLELLVLDDGDLEEIASGADGAAVALDDIDCMTATELRKKLREYKDSQLPEEQAKPLQDTITNLQKQIGNHEKAYEQQQLKLEDTERKLKQLTQRNKPGKDAFGIETMAVREEAHALHFGADTYIKALEALHQKTALDLTPSSEEYALRMETLGIAAGAILHSAHALYTLAKATLGDALPDISGQHVLTALEKERLEGCKIMIQHDFETATAGRAARRDDENRRTPGRPEGAKNKLKEQK